MDTLTVIQGNSHPLLLLLSDLKSSLSNFQNEAHASAVKLQHHSLHTSRALERAHALEHENSALHDELVTMRSTPHASPSSSPEHINQLTLSLRTLNEKLTSTESLLAKRTTELTSTLAELQKSKSATETSYELSARIRGREEALKSRERELELKVQLAVERARTSEHALEEYANLVRTLEGRAGGQKSNGHAMIHLPITGGNDQAEIQRLLQEFARERENLQIQLSSSQHDLALLTSQHTAHLKFSETSLSELVDLRMKLQLLERDDTTATKMVSRYMKFSQTQTNALQTSLTSLTTRHSATLTSLTSHINTLTHTLNVLQSHNTRLLHALDDLGSEVLKEGFGRRRETRLRIKLVGREEKVLEGLRRWLRRAEEGLGRIGTVKGEEGREDSEGVLREMIQDAKILIDNLDHPLPPIPHPDEEGSSLTSPVSGSLARLITIQSAIDDLVEDIQREQSRRIEVERLVVRQEIEGAGSTGARESGGLSPVLQHSDNIGPIKEEVVEPSKSYPHKPPLTTSAPSADGSSFIDPIHEFAPPKPPIPTNTDGSEVPPPTPPPKPQPPPTIQVTPSLAQLEPGLEVDDTAPPAFTPVGDRTRDQVDEEQAHDDGREIDVQSGATGIDFGEGLGGERDPPSVDVEVNTSDDRGTLQDEEEVGKEVETEGVEVQVHTDLVVDLDPDINEQGVNVVELSVTPALGANIQAPIPNNTSNLPSLDAVARTTPPGPEEEQDRIDQASHVDSGAQDAHEEEKDSVHADTGANAAQAPIPCAYSTPPSLLPLVQPRPRPIPTLSLSPQLSSSPSSPSEFQTAASLVVAPPHPLLQQLTKARNRYSEIQRSFHACHIALESLKSSLPSSNTTTTDSSHAYPRYPTPSTSNGTPSTLIPHDVLSAIVQRLDDYTEDVRVELEIRISDEEVLGRGYEALLLLPGALPSTTTSPTSSRTGGESPTSGGSSLGEVEAQILTFISGTDPTTSRAMKSFGKKLEDIEHDVVVIKKAIHDPSSVLSPPTPSSSSASLLNASDDSPPTESSTTPNIGSWTSWIRAPISRPTTPTPSTGPTPTFGNVMTSRNKSSAIRRTASAFGLADSSSPVTGTRANIVKSLGLRIPMPDFTFALTSSSSSSSDQVQLEDYHSPIGSAGLGVLPGFGALGTPRSRAISSSMYLLGMGMSSGGGGGGRNLVGSPLQRHGISSVAPSPGSGGAGTGALGVQARSLRDGAEDAGEEEDVD